MLKHRMNRRAQAGDTISAAQQWCRRGVAMQRRPGFARLGRVQAGDTIVEVMIAIAIVSFVLVAAYVTANKNSLINQDTQERGQALQLATTQLEFLHSKSIGTNSCFDVNGNPVGTAADATPCMVNSDGTKDTSHTQPEYTIAITKDAGRTYKVQVTWPSLLSGSTEDNITMYYQP